jgi:hypothetical protein
MDPPPLPGVPEPTPVLRQKHHGRRTCIPGLEGTLVATFPPHQMQLLIQSPVAYSGVMF